MENSALIIDDDIWIQRIFARTLQNFGFTNTYLASNGFEGISLAVEHRPVLIILDILMPELSGHLTLKVLKHIKITSQIPVLMVSAMSDAENLGRAVKIGTAGFISKPFTKATVLDKLITIFGKETIDRMSKGESVSLQQTTEQVFKNEELPPMPRTEDRLDLFLDIGQKEKPSLNKSIPQDHITNQYQDEEKRSIESIKKLLLKSRK